MPTSGEGGAGSMTIVGTKRTKRWLEKWKDRIGGRLGTKSSFTFGKEAFLDWGWGGRGSRGEGGSKSVDTPKDKKEWTG